MKTIQLSDLLNAQQLVETKRILRSTTNPIERVRRLKDFFETFSDELEAKGVLPAYLAYVVEWQAVEHTIRQQAMNN